MQLKEGDKITDWSPNPEDINAEILAVDSKVLQQLIIKLVK